jgi:hypothetical protein
MQVLALTGHQAHRWEPKRLRLRLLSIAGLLATSARIRTLRPSAHAPWTQLALDGLDRLKALAAQPAPRRIATPPAISASSQQHPPEKGSPAPPRRPRAHCHTQTSQSATQHRPIQDQHQPDEDRG